jgi:peptide chain release factor 3
MYRLSGWEALGFELSVFLQNYSDTCRQSCVQRGVWRINITDEIKKEVSRRRTFAIISHPDAGKTTLTEKLLLYGGAIRLAGAVKGRKAAKHAVSDWMEIEKQRGISVTSSVMFFDYNGYRINILDTPGHQDFSEDTYRTLAAADCAVMLIDGAKGVEAQTRKLFHVCRMRHIPIFTFVNKLDRFCKSPFELMDEIEKTLGIRSYPMNWPIGEDGLFKGVYSRKNSRIELFEAHGHGQQIARSQSGSMNDMDFRDLLGEHLHDKLCEDVSLLDMAGDDFDLGKVRNGELTPMYFGSAMTNFGVKQFLDEFVSIAPSPVKKNSTKGTIEPNSNKFAGFVFKIQANMDPAHRNRIAFIRICSGRFEAGMEVIHERTGKTLRLSQPQQFFAQERTAVEEAFAGDIIGVVDTGLLNIGDTLCESKEAFRFEGIPMFPAEHFAQVRTPDAMRRKQFLQGINQISEEGAIQVFKQPNLGVETLTVGVVGVLQLEVLAYRMKYEYGVDIVVERLPYTLARWVMTKNITREILGFSDSAKVVEDRLQRPVILYKDEWTLRRAEENNKDVEFLDIPPSE